MGGPPPAVARVRSAVRSALRTSSTPVLVAVSGGADSLALAAALAFEAPRAGVPVAAATVDHGLQTGSAERARRTAELLRGLGVGDVHVLTIQVPAAGGPEGAARSARYAALAEAGAGGRVALGHTLDDQAETVLLGLGRGSGPRSIAGMRENRTEGDVTWWRPLLDLPRALTRAACADLALPVWDDPWNTDPAYTRARLRAEVLPLLEDVLGGGVAGALARTAQLLREDLDTLDALAAAELARTDQAGAAGLPTTETAALPIAVRRRVLRSWLLAAGIGNLRTGHLHDVDALLTRWRGQGPVDLPGGRSVLRTSGRLVVRRAAGDDVLPPTCEEYRP